MSGIRALAGTCPTCGGAATVYPHPEDSTGHVYCEADACGWIHRDTPNVARFIVDE